jgi:hypothetical protein
MTDPDYFTLAELRALPDLSDTSRYTDARCLAAAAYITAIIEREVRTSFIARTVTAEIHDGGTTAILLRHPHVRSVTSVTENGTAVTDDVRAPSGVLRRFPTGSYIPLPWLPGVGNVSVTYSAGYSATPPADIKEAAIQATRARLLTMDSQAGIEDRRTSLSTDQGTVNYVIAGEDRPTGYPEVDEVIMGWKRKLDVFGFA